MQFRGVGHDPDAVPAVRSANGGSGYTVPLRIIPDRSERPEHLVQSARAKGCDVFADDPARPRFGDDAVHFPPEAGSFSVEPGALSGEADVLAGESSADGVDMSGQRLSCEGSDVVMDGDSGPVLGDDAASIGVYFAELDGLKMPRAFEAEREPANAGEQV